MSFISRIKNGLSHPYAVFLQKKLVFYTIVLAVALTFIFLIPRIMPGDPAQRILPPQGAYETAEDYEARIADFKEYFGINRPLLDQYVDFWMNLFRLDLGPSLTFPTETTLSVLIPAIFFTFSLVIPVVIVSFILGNWIGGRSAFIKGKTSKGTYYLALLAQSAPFYWLALIIAWFLIYQYRLFGWGFATAGVSPNLSLDYILTLLRYYILPFVTLLIGMTGGWATGMRSMTLYEKESGYLLYAEQLGFKPKTLRQYAQRNAILPQFTGLNLRLSEAIGATLVLEWVFGWPGVGNLLLTSAVEQDFFLLMGASIIVVFVVIIGNFMVDILYGFIDPRIKTGETN